MLGETRYFVDSHAHLDADTFDGDRQEVILRAYEKWVRAIVTIGTGVASSRKAVELAESYDFIYAAIGIDPHAAKTYDDSTWREIRSLTSHPKVRALGETGLDFHYYHSPEAAQILSLRAHIRLAMDTGLPLIIHNREAEVRFLQIIDDEDPAGTARVIMHSFAGTEAFARECFARGYFVSFSGMITFRSMAWLRTIAAVAPLDRLLVETDCPYLAPVPHRGERNEPAFIAETTAALAEILSRPVDQMKQTLLANFLKVFKVELASSD
jgi:TatD DNase family protein